MMADTDYVKIPSPRASKAEWAIYCAMRFGCPVFPCQPNGKKPLNEGWQQEASTNPVEIIGLWADNPNANIGIHMVGRLAIDVDRKPGKNGQASWDDLIETYGGRSLENTLTQETPTGGLHFVYATDRKAKNTQSHVAPDIDTRGEGGYILGAGSTINGQPYVIVHDEPMMTAPDWLMALVGKPRERAANATTAVIDLDKPAQIAAATAYLQDDAPSAIEGKGGDATTYRVACRVRDFGLAEQTALSLMLEHWNEAKAIPPWDPDDLARKVANAYQYATSPAGNRTADAEFDVEEIPIDSALPGLRLVGEFVFSGPPPYTIRGLLTAGSVTMLTGNSDAGKSPLALDMAVAVARGRAWNGMRTRQGVVLHISTEGKATLEARMLAQRMEHGITPDDPLAFVSVSLNLVEGPDTKRVIVAAQQLAERFGLPVGMVVIDTMSHVLGGGDESDPTVTRPLVKNLQRIASETGASVVIVHHPTKDETSLYRGHSSLINDIGALLYVEIDEVSGVRTLSTPRIKDWERIKPRSYGIKVIELMRDDLGDPVTSVVVDWDLNAVAARGADAPLSKIEQKVVEAIGDLLREVAETDGPEAAAKFEITRTRVQERREVGRNPATAALQSLVDRGLLTVATHTGGPRNRTTIYRISQPLEVWSDLVVEKVNCTGRVRAEDDFESET